MKVKKRSRVVQASLSESGEYYTQRPPTPILDTVNYPIHMKNLSLKVEFLWHLIVSMINESTNYVLKVSKLILM